MTLAWNGSTFVLEGQPSIFFHDDGDNVQSDGDRMLLTYENHLNEEADYDPDKDIYIPFPYPHMFHGYPKKTDKLWKHYMILKGCAYLRCDRRNPGGPVHVVS